MASFYDLPANHFHRLHPMVMEMVPRYTHTEFRHQRSKEVLVATHITLPTQSSSYYPLPPLGDKVQHRSKSVHSQFPRRLLGRATKTLSASSRERSKSCVDSVDDLFAFLSSNHPLINAFYTSPLSNPIHCLRHPTLFHPFRLLPKINPGGSFALVYYYNVPTGHSSGAKRGIREERVGGV